MSSFFQDLQAGFGVLQAAGIDVAKAHKQKKGGSPSEQAYTALVGWLERAQSRERLGKCDVHTLASTILGALQRLGLHGARLRAALEQRGAKDYVERLIDLLWNGIGDGAVRTRGQSCTHVPACSEKPSARPRVVASGGPRRAATAAPAPPPHPSLSAFIQPGCGRWPGQASSPSEVLGFSS
jgi:hypothetical protein